MMEFDQDWFYTGPMDYEFKMYTLMAKIKRLRATLKRNVIWPVILEVESQLDGLYRFKYEKETLDDRLKVAKDIDFVNFQIIYEIPADSANEHLDVLHQIANAAIIEFEDVYMDARLAWREIEKQMTLTWVPEKLMLVNRGYVTLIENKDKIWICEFEKPSKLTSDWRNFKFECIAESKYTDITDISKIRETQIGKDLSLLFGRVDYKIPIPFHDTALVIAKSIVWASLMRDFTS